jgi:hypothetical protein
MDIISNNHLETIREINTITNNQVFYGGSLEDYFLLGGSDKPIGDLDVLIYNPDLINIFSNRYSLTNPKGSYFNRFMGEKFTKYNTYINDIKIDFLLSHSELDENNFTESIFDSVVVPHRTLLFKRTILMEWIEKSVPNDMWAHDKFSKILKKYEGLNSM